MENICSHCKIVECPACHFELEVVPGLTERVVGNKVWTPTDPLFKNKYYIFTHNNSFGWICCPVSSWSDGSCQYPYSGHGTTKEDVWNKYRNF